MGPQRPRRADARRNYELLLAAAAEVFAERGVDAPLDEIARRAGVGNATMYRHFPTRQEMIIAVYADEVTALCALGEQLPARHPPGVALRTWLGAFVDHIASKRQLPLALAEDQALAEDSDAQRSEVVYQWHSAMRATASSLLAAAQQAGDVRADVEASDILGLAHGVALAGADAARMRRLTDIAWRGIATVPTA